jgi:Carboxyl transferase domain
MGGRLILEELLGIIPTDIRQPMNMREVLLRLVDGSRMDEFKPLYGVGLITSSAHIHGMHLNNLAHYRSSHRYYCESNTRYLHQRISESSAVHPSM